MKDLSPRLPFSCGSLLKERTQPPCEASAVLHTHTHKPSQRKRTESGSWYLRVLIQPLLTHITQDGPCALSHSSQPHRGQVRCQSRPAGEDAQAAERAAPLCPQMRALPSPHLRPSLGSCTSCLPAGFSQREALAEDGRRGGSVA